ncbi:hypothetical protein WH47_01251, partial [Habropoda laboriosa]
QENSLRAQGLYFERYSNGTDPSHRIFQRFCIKLTENGSLAARKSNRRKWTTDETNEIGVLATVARNSQISSMNHVAFCQRAQREIQMNGTFSSSILFTDEATFTKHENLNLHDVHYWSVETPR